METAFAITDEAHIVRKTNCIGVMPKADVHVTTSHSKPCDWGWSYWETVRTACAQAILGIARSSGAGQALLLERRGEGQCLRPTQGDPGAVLFQRLAK